jgi:hypothetical protein
MGLCSTHQALLQIDSHRWRCTLSSVRDTLCCFFGCGGGWSRYDGDVSDSASGTHSRALQSQYHALPWSSMRIKSSGEVGGSKAAAAALICSSLLPLPLLLYSTGAREATVAVVVADDGVLLRRLLMVVGVGEVGMQNGVVYNQLLLLLELATQHNNNATPVLGRNRSPTKCCCCKQEPLCSVPCDCSRCYANNCQYCCVSACFVDTSCGRRSSYASRSICGTIFALCIVCLLMAVMLDMLMWVVGIATLVLCTPCILMVLLFVIVQS